MFKNTLHLKLQSENTDLAKALQVLQEEDILDEIRFLFLAVGHHNNQTMAKFQITAETTRYAEQAFI